MALGDWAATSTPGRLYLHASGVAIDGQGVLIHGGSGSGKSTLALRLMTLGARLIADDAVRIDLGPDEGGPPFIERPETATDLVECRGIGLLRAGPICGRAPLVLAIDLNRAEPDRLPPRRYVTTGTARVPLILGASHPSLAEGVLWLLRHGLEPPDIDTTG